MPRRSRSRLSTKFFTLLVTGVLGWVLSIFHPLAPDQTGHVVGVHDGDTLTILSPDHHQIRVRLAGIDAPELSQPYGQAAKAALSRLAFGQDVTLSSQGQDKYQRTLAIVRTGSTRLNLNLEMVRAGMAWRYDQYTNDPALLQAQQAAQAQHLGLWAAPDHGSAAPVPPWEWRRAKNSR